MQNVPTCDKNPDSSSTHYVPLLSRRSKLNEERKKRKILCEVSEVITDSSCKEKTRNKRRCTTTRSQERLEKAASKVHKSNSCRRKLHCDTNKTSMAEKSEDDDSVENDMRTRREKNGPCV
jgi:predicted glycosyl hydrolase (DUF1957 family)